MTYTLVANWDEPYDPLGSLVYPRRLEYAARHGYGCVRYGHPGTWGKITALLAAWASADWLWWLDVDATITGMDTRLESLTGEGEMVIGLDIYGPNAGSFLVKTTPTIREFLETCLAHREAFNGPWQDNTALAHLLWHVRDKVVTVPQRLLNSYPDYGRGRPDEVWREGDFVLHCPGLPMDKRLALLGGAQLAAGRSLSVV